MIYIGITKINCVTFADAVLSVASPPYILKLAKETKNGQVRRSRIGAYLTLSKLYEKVFKNEIPRVLKDDNGKPYLESLNNTLSPSVSISHSNDMCSVAICDTGAPIGVDIQIKTESVKQKEISERFFKNVNFSLLKELNEPISVLFYGIDENGLLKEIDNVPMMISRKKTSDHGGRVELSLFMNNILDTKNIGFYTRWTLVESLLKADGRGFGAFSDADRLIERSQSLSYEIYTDKDAYTLSLSKLNCN